MMTLNHQICGRTHFQLPLTSSSKEETLQGHQEVAADVSHQVLDQPFLMGLPRPAKAAHEQMVGAKGDKLPLLFAAGAGQHPFDGGGQVVVDDDFGDPAQFLKSGYVAGEESFLGSGKAITENRCE